VIVSQGREIRPLQDSDLRTPIVKILDTYARLPSARELAFAPTITRFMTALFEEKPLAFQSLHFEVGSTQAVHQDTAYVVLDTPKKLAAVWIALEDIEEGSGELIYYPGSHRFGEFMYPGDRKHWVAEEDGHPIHNHHLNWLHEEAKRRGVAQQAFRPRKGDALVWHADLAHGGGEIRDRTKTRRSLVVHYAPGSATPHYFKFVDQRRQTKVPHRDAGFLSSFFYDL
jgi:ectoine hydroxylase-related dioxygenase (phytanoyl-CoA dioxygenase family)